MAVPFSPDARDRAEAEGDTGIYRSSAAAGVDPVMGIGPVPATQRCLQKVGLDVGRMTIELNEAFAAQLAVVRESGMNPTVSTYVEAPSLGDPRCSGARTTTYCTRSEHGGGRGLATLCVGVFGVATFIETV